MIGNIVNINRRRPEEMIPKTIDRFDKMDENDGGILTTDEIDQLIANIGEDADLLLDQEVFISQLNRNGNREGTPLQEEAVGLRDLLGPPNRPPRHRTLDAIKTYGEVAAAETEEENQPPTIVVPV